MDLTDEQITLLKQKASEGGQLNDLQKLIQNDFGKSITYMETRFLISDLGIEIVTEIEPEPEEPEGETTNGQDPSDQQAVDADASQGSKVQVQVDQVTRPGAMVNGSVVWSDGVTSTWVLDQMGQLGLESSDESYQPGPDDVQEFQLQLRQILGG